MKGLGSTLLVFCPALESRDISVLRQKYAEGLLWKVLENYGSLPLSGSWIFHILLGPKPKTKPTPESCPPPSAWISYPEMLQHSTQMLTRNAVLQINALLVTIV